MYKNDRWGHRSFHIQWPEDEIINVSDTDPKDRTDAMLNFVDESLNITQRRCLQIKYQSQDKMYFYGACAGLCATAIGVFGLSNGLFCSQNIACMLGLAVCSFSALANHTMSKCCDELNAELGIERSKVIETRQSIEQFK